MLRVGAAADIAVFDPAGDPLDGDLRGPRTVSRWGCATCWRTVSRRSRTAASPATGPGGRSGDDSRRGRRGGRPTPSVSEILRHALTGITDEMSVTLRRAAYSTNIKTRLDFSCALFDGRARIVAQSFAQPIHLGTLATFVPAILERYGRPLEAGDALLCNEGHLGGLHLNDVCLLAAARHRRRARSRMPSSMAHHVDVGGGTPGSIGLHREQYQEGLIIPPVRLMHDGVIDPDVLGDAHRQRPLAARDRGRPPRPAAAVSRSASDGSRSSSPSAASTRSSAASTTSSSTPSAGRSPRSRGLPRGTIEATDYLDDDGVSDVPVEDLGTDHRHRGPASRST